MGSGAAKILTECAGMISDRAGIPIRLVRIVDINAPSVIAHSGLQPDLFAGGGKKLTSGEASQEIQKIITDTAINCVIETIGGTSDWLNKAMTDILKSGKHLITANKAMLAERGAGLSAAADAAGVSLGFEAAVCGAIPIIKNVLDSFSGDEIISITGIMNGTSNYILSKMQEENLDFDTALSQAQKAGYAEADPTLDIGGGDAGHKLCLLTRLAFGMDIPYETLPISGITAISPADIDFAAQINCAIRLVCHAEIKNDELYAAVRPAMVRKENFLSGISGALNAVQIHNRFAGTVLLNGKGAGSLETASAVISDTVCIARYPEKNVYSSRRAPVKKIPADFSHLPHAFILSFETKDTPGVAGLIATALGAHKINIDTVGHNRKNKDRTIFTVAVKPCPGTQLDAAVAEITNKNPGVIIGNPKIMPII